MKVVDSTFLVRLLRVRVIAGFSILPMKELKYFDKLDI